MISRRPFVSELTLVVLVLGLLGTMGLLVGDTEVGYEVMDENLDALRTAFNAHPESVRAVLLVAPT